MAWSYSKRQKMNYNMMFKIFLVMAVIMWMFHPINSSAREVEEEGSFVVIEKLYPFQEPDKILEQLEELLEQEHAVVIGIMPIYNHTDYPSMTEFLEVMRYAQSRGCRMLIHFPIVQKEDATWEEVRNVLQPVIEYYESEDIHLQGILFGEEDETYFMWEEDMEELLPVFYADTVLQTSRLPYIPYVYQPKDIPVDYDFHRNVMDNISVSLDRHNRVLFVIVTVAILIFTAMIIYARWLNKRKFFEEKDEDE